jgi:lysophospholipase L1-like esterase
MQKRFGGSGCGLIPAVPLYNGKMSIKQNYSEDWQRFTGFTNRDSTIDHKRYGALFGFSSIRSQDQDSSSYEWLEFRPSPLSFTTSRHFNNISLIIGKTNSLPLNLRLLINDSIFDEINVVESFKYNRLNWKLSDSPEKIKFEISPNQSLSVYGVSLDNDWGIAVDNVPLRGSSGLVFSKTDTVFLKQMYQDMDVGLIILQFGGNAVPYMKNVAQYENFFRRELNVLKRLVPDVPLIVVGPSDMSIKENGSYITHPNLEKIRDAIRSATLGSGYAFWDMYEAMGGRNSMPSWVFAEPALAISDFVHFNNRGARVIGEMIYNSIIYEYNIWKEKTSGLVELTNN